MSTNDPESKLHSGFDCIAHKRFQVAFADYFETAPCPSGGCCDVSSSQTRIISTTLLGNITREEKQPALKWGKSPSATRLS